jgi:hypothetical protein
MTDTFDQGNEDNKAVVSRKVIRKLEKDAQAGRDAIKELEALRSRTAFLEAGVPADDPRAEYFRRGYSGDPDPQAIRSEWEKTFGSVQSGQQDPILQAELDSLNQGNQIASGVGTPTQDKLAERDAKLRSLSPTDPMYPVKFDAIAREYGTVYGDMVG